MYEISVSRGENEILISQAIAFTHDLPRVWL